MRTKPFIIGIAGPACSGKAELARCLAHWAPAVSPVILHMDSYYLDFSHLEPAERERSNFDDPESMDWDLAMEQVMTISRGGEIEKPLYDCSTHARLSHTAKVGAGDLVIVVGLFALYCEEMREMYDFSIFVEADAEVCLGRRLQRDLGHRSRSIQTIIRQYLYTVKPLYEKNVLPTKRFADIVVRGEQAAEKSAAKIMPYLNQSFRFQLSKVGL